MVCRHEGKDQGRPKRSVARKAGPVAMTITPLASLAAKERGEVPRERAKVGN